MKESGGERMCANTGPSFKGAQNWTKIIGKDNEKFNQVISNSIK